MKTSVKTFAYAAIASIAFLACDTGTNNSTEQQDDSILSSSSVLSSDSSELCSSISSSSSVLLSSSSELLSSISSSSSIIICRDEYEKEHGKCKKCIEFDDEVGKCRTYEGEIPYDPENFPCTFEGGVEYWMEEQLASGKNDRALLRVVDMLSPEFEYSGQAYPVERRGEICYLIEGREVNVEEYNKYIEDYKKERAEKRRVSPMIGIFVDNSNSLYYDGWRVLMTAKEIVELIEKYNGLIIMFPTMYVDG